MKLTQLKYFKTVAELGKIVTAAEALYISSPALSATINSLEKELGVPLFDRTSNRIMLNEQGRIFLRYVNQIFNNIDCAKMELQQSLGDAENKCINIAVATSDIWAPLISAFALEYPDIMLSCATMKLSQMYNVNLSRLHAFIFAGKDEFNASDVESICLFKEHPMAIVPIKHPLADRSVIQLEELVDEILFFPMADHSLNKRIRELFYTNQLPLKHIHECSGTVCRSMVMEGRGISITASHPNRADVPSVRYIPINAPGCQWEQYIFWNKERKLSPGEIRFKDFVIQMYCH